MSIKNRVYKNRNVCLISKILPNVLVFLFSAKALCGKEVTECSSFP
ncbi:hypothetical protein LEP1GSC188_3471 [Leptospira weilii serovar Topaz str. LT2116]|uniref:Uncharacterized protein n=1 Tax=Leptospira weilii serovar Topaz str. LT2116 TaxID=1088540 RepID=M3GW49_9LEPT|nr:hypothetical protein LEP1GSC188_3471 [Leptospira weilii serovar Topaz str. LT2116]